MSKYINVKVNISEGQRRKLKAALENNVEKVSIQLDHEDLNGEDVLALTKRRLIKWRKRFGMEREPGLLLARRN